MTSQDQLMKDTFPEPPLVAYKRQKNLGDFLIRAKVNPKNNRKSNRKLRGMKKCGQECHACPYINERKNIKSGNHTWNIENILDCNTENIVYLIQCDKENCPENK